MKTYRYIGWGLIVVAAIFWFLAIGGASANGFFEYQNGVQMMILGGAISMVGGVFLWYHD